MVALVRRARVRALSTGRASPLVWGAYLGRLRWRSLSRWVATLAVGPFRFPRYVVDLAAAQGLSSAILLLLHNFHSFSRWCATLRSYLILAALLVVVHAAPGGLPSGSRGRWVDAARTRPSGGRAGPAAASAGRVLGRASPAANQSSRDTGLPGGLAIWPARLEASRSASTNIQATGDDWLRGRAFVYPDDRQSSTAGSGGPAPDRCLAAAPPSAPARRATLTLLEAGRRGRRRPPWWRRKQAARAAHGATAGPRARPRLSRSGRPSTSGDGPSGAQPGAVSRRAPPLEAVATATGSLSAGGVPGLASVR